MWSLGPPGFQNPMNNTGAPIFTAPPARGPLGPPIIGAPGFPQHRFNNTIPIGSPAHMKKAVELLNEQLQHQFKLLHEIGAKKQHDKDPQYMAFFNNLKRLATVDKNLLNIWDKIPGLLGRINRSGKNKDIDKSFYKLLQGYFDIQNNLFIKYYNRGQSEPELKPIIDLLGEKMSILNEVMKISLPEEADLQADYLAFQNVQYPDLRLLRYNNTIQPHVNGAAQNQNPHDAAQLNTLFTNSGILRYATVPVDQMPELDLKFLYNTMQPTNNFVLPIDNATAFGSFYNLMVETNTNGVYIQYNDMNAAFYSTILLRNISFLYTKISDIISTNDNSKVFTLLLDTNLYTNERFRCVVNTLFLPLTTEDINACQNLKGDIYNYIDNDTSIALNFIETTNVKYIFIFRLISSIYEGFFKHIKHDTSAFYNTIAMNEINYMFMRLTYYIKQMDLTLAKYGNDNIKTAYTDFIKKK